MAIEDYLKIAAETAIARNREHWFRRNFMVGACAIRADGAIVKSSNSPTKDPCRQIHAEHRLCRKLDYGGVVFVVRVRRDGTYGNAKPCGDCEKILKSRKVKKVYYTNHLGEIESLEL